VFTKKYSSFLRPIDFPRLKLYGERRSRIIWEQAQIRGPIEERSWPSKVGELAIEKSDLDEKKTRLDEKNRELKGRRTRLDKRKAELEERMSGADNSDETSEAYTNDVEAKKAELEHEEEKLEHEEEKLESEMGDVVCEMARVESDMDELFAKTQWLSIPYDANISFFVCRKDILDRARGELDLRVVKQELHNLLVEEARLMTSTDTRLPDQDYYDAIRECDPFAPTAPSGEVDDKFKRIIIISKMVDHVARRVVAGKLPETWEEMIVIAKLLDKRILLETQSFNTYLCTFLELIWNSGGDLTVNPDYTFSGKTGEGDRTHLLRAFHLFRSLFRTGVSDRNSTLETQRAEGATYVHVGEQPTNWLFARHWYSTMVDTLTAKDEEGRYLWCDGEAMDLELMPVPSSLSLWIRKTIEKTIEKTPDESPSLTAEELNRFCECSESHFCEDITRCEETKGCALKKINDGKGLSSLVDHHACWGEWSFGLMSGSENQSLAIDLINNLMTNSKICERAFNGACLPTVEAFYEMYGDVKCLDLPERPEVSMPSLSYNQLRSQHFRHAKTRLDIYDFRHVAKILHSKMEAIRKSQVQNEDSSRSHESAWEDEKIWELCKSFLDDVGKLAEMSIMLGDS